MMTPDEILREANLAFHENRTRDWCRWHSLLHILWLSDPTNAKGVEDAKARLAMRRPNISDDFQWDYEREAEAQGVNLTELLR